MDTFQALREQHDTLRTTTASRAEMEALAQRLYEAGAWVTDPVDREELRTMRLYWLQRLGQPAGGDLIKPPERDAPAPEPVIRATLETMPVAAAPRSGGWRWGLILVAVVLILLVFVLGVLVTTSRGGPALNEDMTALSGTNAAIAAILTGTAVATQTALPTSSNTLTGTPFTPAPPPESPVVLTATALAELLAATAEALTPTDWVTPTSQGQGATVEVNDVARTATALAELLAGPSQTPTLVAARVTPTYSGNLPTTGGGGGYALPYEFEPSGGSVALIAEDLDRFTVRLEVYGDLPVQELWNIYPELGDNRCQGTPAGFIAPEPSFRVQYAGEDDDRPLSFFFNADVDTSMMIYAPDGNWYCDDDSGGGLQPLLSFAQPLNGKYRIWIGVLNQQDSPTARLYVSHDPARLPAPAIQIEPGTLTPSPLKG